MAFGNATKGYVLKHSGGGGGGGTSNYNQLSNKPQINGVELTGNKTSADLNIGGGISFVDITSDIFGNGVNINSIAHGVLVTADDGTSNRRMTGILLVDDIINDREFVFGYGQAYCNNKFTVASDIVTMSHMTGRTAIKVYKF